MNIWYLAGPMTGHPKDNLPAFLDAAEQLRRNEFIVISPAELDDTEAVQEIIDGSTKTFNELVGRTWGTALARDVKLIADRCDGIIFLDGWEKSRGARLEAFTGLLKGVDFHFTRYIGDGHIEGMTAHMVLTKVARSTLEDIRNV